MHGRVEHPREDEGVAVNKEHLDLCRSAEWADAVSRWIVPWTLEGVELGASTVEIGPGPGLTTDALTLLVADLTAVEIDPDLATSLAERFVGDPRVKVVAADAADTGLPTASADSAVCLTMLHHVPTLEHQDAIFAEIRRLLVPGGLFAGSDSLDSPEFRDLHRGDVCLPVSPETLDARLRAAGFAEVAVDTNPWAVRFRAVTPLGAPGSSSTEDRS